MSEITCQEDLDGMLPSEIVAAFTATEARADRLAAENAELREAGNALAKAGLRVVRGEGTTQRYEYLLTAIERWEALVGTEEG